MTEKRYFNNKTAFLENVSGYRIVEEQKKINGQPNAFIVATQIFLKEGKMVKRRIPSTDGVETLSEHQAYDCFIYYKEKPEVNEETVSSNKLDLVLPE